ncbi:MAG: cation transporting ATPase C-terminal domain-containing protein [Oscillospiraceae bacterium]|nr:cation transporting ATPase C-terminal domain-containing protein [Oscillospiraceae bacterium]
MIAKFEKFTTPKIRRPSRHTLGSFIGVETPINVIQMLWINIVMDTLAWLAFSGEKARQLYLLIL